MPERPSLGEQRGVSNENLAAFATAHAANLAPRTFEIL